MGTQSNALAQSVGPWLFISLFCFLAAVVLGITLFIILRRLTATGAERTELRTRLGVETEKATRLGTEVAVRDERLAAITSRLNTLETQRETERVDLKERIRELEKTRILLEAEQRRIASEEMNRRKEEEEVRDRMWNVHEREAISRMTGICGKSELLLSCYTNTNLPDNLDPALKPDFLIELLGQYVIFDAKASRTGNLQTYISTQAKKTADKLNAAKDRHLIYRQVFFVVPGSELPSLKQTLWYEQGYTFFVISLEAFEPIVTALKRLEDYEFAGRFDPQEREALVGLLAAFDQHIRRQNAGNILSTLQGLAVLSGSASLPGDMAEEVEKRRKNIRIENFRPSELKKLIDDPDYQIREIARLVRPASPDIRPDELAEAAGESEETDE